MDSQVKRQKRKQDLIIAAEAAVANDEMEENTARINELFFDVFQDIERNTESIALSLAKASDPLDVASGS